MCYGEVQQGSLDSIKEYCKYEKSKERVNQFLNSPNKEDCCGISKNGITNGITN